MIDRNERVAIVGIGGIFPGAPGLDRFWANLRDGFDATTEVPQGRWALDPAKAYDPRPATADRVYATRGGFVDDSALNLDGLNVEPALVDRLDPSFKLALHAGGQAWRDARTEAVDPARVGVIFGNIVLPTESTSKLTSESIGRTFESEALGTTFQEHGNRPTDRLNRFAAGLPAGLLAKALGLGGGAYTLDAACASSLYAIKLAVDELLEGRADAMLSGGLSRPDPLYTQMGFAQLRALSPTGTASPFDAKADGLVVGEGAGFFVLKRLTDAIEQEDRIYGIVTGAGLSNDVDGGLLAPSSEGQLRAMRAAYERSGKSPQDVDLIECHATGTPVGDAVEFESLKALWSGRAWKPGGCVIGSHKANIGHALTAAGAAGLLKVLLALKHETLPPTPNFEQPGSHIDLEASPFRILKHAVPWNRRSPDQPRLAAISGFGFGGINAHILIEEYLPSQATSTTVSNETPSNDPIAIVGLSARVGCFNDLRSFQIQALGGTNRREPEDLPNHWGLLDAEWVDREGLPTAQAQGFPIHSLSIPLGRFRIPPRELAEMLPQQSLALLAAADAIADAGWDDLPKLRAGVFLGIGLDPNTNNFQLRWAFENQADAWNQEQSLDESSFERWKERAREALGPALNANRTMGALGGLIASRVAREFRIGGPSFTISAEENSGLQALEIASRMLQRGELDQAVVGAVDLTSDPRLHLEGLLDISRSDGAVALVLKRYQDALRDGDRIFAKIVDIGAASGDSIDSEHPDPKSLVQAIQRAGVEFDTLGYIDVTANDRQTTTRVEGFAASGSSTDDLGHLGAATGLASLVKAVVCLDQHILPEHRRFDGFQTHVIPPRYWLTDRNHQRTAAVVCRGIDGNVRAVALSEHDRLETPTTLVKWPQPVGPPRFAIFNVQGDDPLELLKRLDLLKQQAQRIRPGSIHEIARHWWRAHRHDSSKHFAMAILSDSTADLLDLVDRAINMVASHRESATIADERIHYRRNPLRGDLVFVFPGIGNHFVGMGRALSAHWPEIFRAMERETSRLKTQLEGASWDRVETPGPSFPDQRAPILGQVVMGTAIADWLASFGIVPKATIGYSLGESSALFANRVWTERDLIHDRLDRSPLFQTDLAGPCHAAKATWNLDENETADWLAGILPVSPERVRRALSTIPRAYLLIINSDQEVVIGGDRQAVEAVVQALNATFLPLPTVSTVHCAIARQVEDAYRELHRLRTTPQPSIRVYSTAWAEPYEPTSETAADAIVAQSLDTVDFPRVIRRAYDDGARIFVEVGPGASCSRLIRSILVDRPHFAKSACAPSDDPIFDALDLLGRLIAEGVAVDLAPLYDNVVDVSNPPAKTLQVAVGAPRFQKIEPPLPLVDDRRLHHQEAHVMNGTGTAERIVRAPRIAVQPVLLDDPLTSQVFANESAKADAHAAYLRVSGGLSQTLSNHLAFQMALIETLLVGSAMAPVEEEEAVIDQRPKPVLDREQCLEFAVGRIGKVLGPEFALVDAYPTRVRLPDEPLMLVDRILEIEGEPRSMTKGRVVTEHDVKPNTWYLDCGRIPTWVAVESGQADLFLSGYLGIDFITKGLAVYRLLDAVVQFHRPLPGPGEVIHYDIQIVKFFRQGETYLFKFQFEATVDGAPLLSMRDGCAGFFSAAELAAGKGVVHTALDLRKLPGKHPDDWRTLVPMMVESYDDRQIEALRHGDLERAFGPAFSNLGLRDPIRLPGGMLTLSHRVPHLDPNGGRFGLGLIRSELDIPADAWFITCHFVDDRVMPGTLMYECCLHALRIYLMRMGWIAEAEGVAFEPVVGVASRLRCRGQVIESTRKALFELTIKEIGYGPEPFAIADALMYADGKPVVEVIDMSLRMTGTNRQAIEAIWQGRTNPAVFTREQVLAFALGKPSEAFGAPYLPFDHDRVIARLPAPPYSFLDRIVEVDCPPWKMSAGGVAAGEYDVPADAWYFESNRQRQMPFAVLLEIPLQVCGWLSAYVGSALTSDRDLAYRNLGGSGTLLADVGPEIGRLTSTVRLTKVSNSGGMIIQHFDIETKAGPALVYRGDTYFGFFLREALLNQVGIREATPYQPTSDEMAAAAAFPFPDKAPFPDETLRMIDQVDVFLPNGGPFGLGYLQGSTKVDPSSWFFHAHFHQDPVVPGSLGLESFQQLLKVFALERWKNEIENLSRIEFEPIGLDEPHRWVYRGQVIPADHLVKTSAVIKAVDDPSKTLKADGYLSVDGRVIYQMIDFTIRIRIA